MFSLYFTCEFTRQETNFKDRYFIPNEIMYMKWDLSWVIIQKKSRIHLDLLMFVNVCVFYYFISQKYNNSDI